MTELQPADVVGRIRILLESHYVFPDVADALSDVLAAGLAADRYPVDARALADVVTTDLQSVNGDKHLRLLFHEQALADRVPGDDAEEFAAMARWADQTCGGIARVQLLDGNVGNLDLQPVLFPAAVAADSVTAAMSLLAGTDALVVDVRGCLGGEPGMVAFLISYLWDHEPVQLTGLRARSASQLTQSWTLPHVPGRRFGKNKPVYVVTSGVTFSGGEQFAYDLQQLGRATVVGERTRGGANARQGFPVHPHLEVTISVAEAVHPGTGTNWETTGVAPDVAAEAGQARDVAYQAALRDLIAARGPASAAAERALAASTA